MLTGMRMLILGQLYQNIRSLASFGVIKICGVLFRWSLSGVLKWLAAICAALVCVCLVLPVLVWRCCLMKGGRP